MGARIEISIEEYNGFKEKINTLEKLIAISDKKNEELETNYLKVKDALDYIINGTTWAERTFQWKQIIKAIKSYGIKNT